MRLAIDAAGQDRQVWRDKRHSLSGEAAERALIAAMAGPVLRWRALIVNMGAKLGGVAKERLELGCDRRVIGAGESRRGHRRRRRSGEKLNDERERDEKGRKRRTEARHAKFRPTYLLLPFGAAHVDSPLRPERTPAER